MRSSRCLIRLLQIMPLIIILIIGVIFYWPALFGNKVFWAFDIINVYYPWRNNSGCVNLLISDPVNAFYPPRFYLAYRFLNDSSIFMPLWFPNSCGGMPFDYCYTSLLNLLFKFFSVELVHDWLLFIHSLLAGIMMFYYLRQVRLGVIAATFGAATWMFNGYVMVWLEFEHVPMLAAYLPGILLFIEHWWQKRDWRSWLGVVFFLAASVAVGYASLLIFQFLLVVGYLAWKWLGDWRTRRGFAGLAVPVVAMGAAGLAALLLNLPFLISHWYLLQDGQRVPYSFHDLFARAGQLPTEYLWTLIFPWLFGGPTMIWNAHADALSKLYNNINELCIYSGAAAALLLIPAVTALRRNGYARFYGAVLIATWAMAMGSILYYPLYRFIPGLNLSTPTRILYLSGFAMTVMAAIGADRLLRGRKPHVLTGAAIALAGLLILSWAGILQFYPAALTGIFAPVVSVRPNDLFTYADGLHSSWRVVILPAVSVGVLLPLLLGMAWSRDRRRKKILLLLLTVITAAELIFFGRSYNTLTKPEQAYPSTPGIAMLRQDKSVFRVLPIIGMMPNSLTGYGFEETGGYSSFFPRRYAEFVYAASTGNDYALKKFDIDRLIAFDGYITPQYDLLNVKYVVAPPDYKMVGRSPLRLIYDREMKIYENPRAFPRAFYVPEYVKAATPQEALRLTGQSNYLQLRTRVVLEEAPSGVVRPAGKEPPTRLPGKAEILNYSSDRIRISVNCTAPGLVAIGNNWHHWWRAGIDGQEAPGLRANYFMQAVEVPAGSHELVMTFRPWPVIAAILISLAGWVIIIGLAVWLAVRRLRRKSPVGRNRAGAL